jgi:hypothetical protein
VSKYHGRDDHIAAQLLKVGAEQMKTELGMNGHLLSHDYDIYKNLVTDGWWKSTWQFVNTNALRVEDDIPDRRMHRRQRRIL